jgi:hypothetical protein
MGQYFHIVNLDKGEFLYDHTLSEYGVKGLHGIKWGEIVFGEFTTLHLLGILIASDTSFGERQNPSFVGRWMGDRIGMYGDDSGVLVRIC